MTLEYIQLRNLSDLGIHPSSHEINHLCLCTFPRTKHPRYLWPFLHFLPYILHSSNSPSPGPQFDLLE